MLGTNKMRYIFTCGFVPSKLFTLFATISCVSVLPSITSTPATSNADNPSGTVSGQTLIDVGGKFNMTMLRVIGKAMKNMENRLTERLEKKSCRFYPCGEWTKWSYCDFSADIFRQIGVRNRSRKCGLNTTICEKQGIPNVVYDSEICEQKCPDDYSVTKHGFCLKLYMIPKQRDEAEKVCQADGGHLANIDSAVKVQDVNETITNPSAIRPIYIDGRRSVRGGPFAYGYRPDDPSFNFWGDNDPDNGPTELCIIYNHDPLRWYDYPCTYSFKFMCEIRS